jgi:dsDNA-specific endonuclease/ATPase MutS2
MRLTELWRGLWSEKESKEIGPEIEPPLGADEDPFGEPVVMEIRDVIDLHAIPPKQVKAVVKEYLLEARARRFPYVRIIHGKGVGAQRAMIRKILDRTSFIIRHYDAPPDAGGLGATIAELDLDEGG